MAPKRRRFHKHSKNHQENTGESKDGSKPRQKTYNDIIKENKKFVEYYKTQGVTKPEEFDEFISTLKTDLPSTFRITGSKGVAHKVLKIVEEQLIKDCVDKSDPNEKLPNIFPLPWYPNKLAWQIELTRKDIRRCEAYYKLHNFLISETKHGTISRQETVSMIPPLVLDIKPHHKILDMCAAPGSKTAQLLELLHANDNAMPSGYVIANDIDNQRCYMLVHQAKRLNSANVAIINHDSAILPNLMHTVADGSVQEVKFDRILCDVPCSGDGTLRKNPDIWMKWTPANGLNLHDVQYRILKRGVELLEEGGRLVYSTCSINPIENESVIHRIMAETDDTLELVDVGSTLPGLQYAPGMESWLVGTKDLKFYKSFDEVDKMWHSVVKPQMFPPKLEEGIKYHLNRCIRILPHQQNTGAFFVAVLQKTKPLNFKKPQVQNKSEDNNTPANDESIAPSHSYRKRPRKEGYKEDPFVFFNENEPVWEEIKSFYQISDEFNSRCLLTRCHSGKKKIIYLTSDAVRDLVVTNQNSIKFINTGVKAFVRCDNKNMLCAFRIANDGLESIYPYIGDDRKVNIPKDDLITLLLNDDPQHSPPISSLSENVQKQTDKLSPGSCVLVYTEEASNSEEPLVIYISGWRGTQSLRCYMSKHSTVHLLRLLGGDISKFDVNKFKKDKEAEGDSKNEELSLDEQNVE